LVDRFCFCFVLPFASRLRGHLQRRANHGSICDSSLLTGPMTISGYAWGHIVATGPWRKTGTSAPLILTHDPGNRRTAANGCKRFGDQLRSICFERVCRLSRLPLHPFCLELLSSFPKAQRNSRQLPCYG